MKTVLSDDYKYNRGLVPLVKWATLMLIISVVVGGLQWSLLEHGLEILLLHVVKLSVIVDNERLVVQCVNSYNVLLILLCVEDLKLQREFVELYPACWFFLGFCWRILKQFR